MGAISDRSLETDEEKQNLLHKNGARRGSGANLQRLATPPKHSGAVRVMLAVAVASGWMFVSSLLIMVNKYILKDLQFG